MKNKIIIVVLVLAIGGVSGYFFLNKSEPNSKFDNKRTVESFMKIDVKESLDNYPKLELFTNEILAECKKSELPITSILRKVSIDKYSQSAFLIIVSDLDKDKSLISSYKYEKQKIQYTSYSMNTIEMNGFFGVCDDHYIHVKSKKPTEMNDYTYLFAKGDNLLFLNVKEDSLGSELNAIKGKCGEVLIKDNVDFINKLIEHK